MTKLGECEGQQREEMFTHDKYPGLLLLFVENARYRETEANDESTNDTRIMLYYRFLRRSKWKQLYYYFPTDCENETIMYEMIREWPWWQGIPHMRIAVGGQYSLDVYCGICCRLDTAQRNGMDACVVLVAIGNIEMKFKHSVFHLNIILYHDLILSNQLYFFWFDFNWYVYIHSSSVHNHAATKYQFGWCLCITRPSIQNLNKQKQKCAEYTYLVDNITCVVLNAFKSTLLL